MTGMHKCMFCGTEIAIEHKAGRIPEYCSAHCRNARKYLNAYLRELRHIDLDKCAANVRSELFMIANTVVKASNCRATKKRRNALTATCSRPGCDSTAPIS